MLKCVRTYVRSYCMLVHNTFHVQVHVHACVHSGENRENNCGLAVDVCELIATQNCVVFQHLPQSCFLNENC